MQQMTPHQRALYEIHLAMAERGERTKNGSDDGLGISGAVDSPTSHQQQLLD